MVVFIEKEIITMYNDIYFTTDMIRNARYLVKKSLAFQGYSIGSSHIAEAFAYSFGFNTNIAFEKNMEESPCLAGDGIRVEEDFDGSDKFFKRLNELSAKKIPENGTYMTALKVHSIDSVFNNYKFSLEKKIFYKWIENNIDLPKNLIRYQKNCLLLIKDCFQLVFKNNTLGTYGQLIQCIAKKDDEISKISLQVMCCLERNFCALIIQQMIPGIELIYGPDMANKYKDKSDSLINYRPFSNYQTIVLPQKDHWSLCKEMIHQLISLRDCGRTDFCIQENRDGSISNAFSVRSLINGKSVYKLYTFNCPLLRGNNIYDSCFDKDLWESFRESLIKYLGGSMTYSQRLKNGDEVIELDSCIRVDLKNQPYSLSVMGYRRT